LRGIAVGRKAGLFLESERGGERAAAIYSLIATAKLNDVDPRAWLTYVLARIGDPPALRLDELLPWNWSKGRAQPTSTKQNGLRRIDSIRPASDALAC
jgi:transposase